MRGHITVENTWSNGNDTDGMPSQIARHGKSHRSKRTLSCRVSSLAWLTLVLQLKVSNKVSTNQVESEVQDLTAAALDTKITIPLSPSAPSSGSTLTRCFNTNLVKLKDPVRLTANAKSQRSSEWGSPCASMILAAVPTPAQLITPPRQAFVSRVHATVDLTAASICDAFVMSVSNNLRFGW